MADVYWKKIEPEKNIAKLALFLSFFPIIMEGPICMYSDTAETLAKVKTFEARTSSVAICGLAGDC